MKNHSNGEKYKLKEFHEEGMRKILAFRAEDETYCIDINLVSSIQSMNELVHNAETTSPLGWINIPGATVAVHTFAECMNMAGSWSLAKGQVLVIRTSKPWGLGVERVLNVFELDEAEIHRFPDFAQNKALMYYKGMINRPDGYMPYLDLDKIDPYLDRPEIIEDEAPKKRRDVVRPTARTPRLSADDKISGRLLIFKVWESDEGYDDITFGLSVAQIIQITEILDAKLVPSLPPFVLGIANWRGIPIPIIDLALRLGYETSPVYSNGRTLIVRDTETGQLFGFPIRPAVKAVDLPIDYKKNEKEVSFDSYYARGVFVYENELLVIPDLNRLVS